MSNSSKWDGKERRKEDHDVLIELGVKVQTGYEIMKMMIENRDKEFKDHLQEDRDFYKKVDDGLAFQNKLIGICSIGAPVITSILTAAVISYLRH